MIYDAVKIILFDAKGRFLLQHRSGDAKLLPGYWAFFGGAIEKGETPEGALRREIYEEINYVLESPVFLQKEYFVEQDTEGYIYIYIEKFNGDKTRLRLREGQGWGWFSLKEIDNLKILNRDKKIITSVANCIDGNKEEISEKKLKEIVEK